MVDIRLGPQMILRTKAPSKVVFVAESRYIIQLIQPDVLRNLMNLNIYSVHDGQHTSRIVISKLDLNGFKVSISSIGHYIEPGYPIRKRSLGTAQTKS